MKQHRLVIYLVLVVLILQPIAAIMTVPHIANGLSNDQSTAVLAQDYGSRLEPAEYTNHVPVLIEGTTDFDSQGWPGSGTSGDPYLIEGLNITSNVGQVSIRVINTDAHFVIRDCLLDQMSNIRAIELVNTSHGSIEYTSIDSDGGGIYLENANETLVSHVNSTTDNDYPIAVYWSDDVTVDSSWGLSISYRSLQVDECNRLEVEDTIFRNHPDMYGIRVYDSNHTSFKDSAIYEAYYGLSAYNCLNTSLYSMKMIGDDIGLYLDNCNDTKVVDSHIESDDDWAAHISDSHDLHLNDSYFQGGVGNGLLVQNSNDTIFYNNVVNYTGSSYGAQFENFYNLIVDSCSFLDIAGVGLRVSNVDKPIITNNVFEETTSYGCYINPSHNGEFSGNSLEMIGSYGLYLNSCENWTINENTFEHISSRGIYVSGGTNAEIYDNEFSTTGSDSIYADGNDDCVIVHNTASESGSYGVLSINADRVTIENNTVLESNKGIFLRDAINASVSYNTVLTSDVYGLYLQYLTNVEVMNNTLTDCAWIGIYVFSVVNATFMYNIMESCGFHFQTGWALQHYNHTLTGNLVNGESIYYGVNAFGASIDGNDYPQVILVNSSDATVTGGVFDSVSSAVQVFYSHRVDIVGITSTDNHFGVTVNLSDNCTVSDIETKGINDDSVGLVADMADRVHVWNSTFDSHLGTDGYGIVVRDTDLALVENCTLSYNGNGIGSFRSDNTTVSEVWVWHTEYDAISSSGGIFVSQYFRLENSLIYNATRGLSIFDSNYGVVLQSEFHHCSSGIYAGEFFGASDYWHINQSFFESCVYGMNIDQPDLWNIHNNTVLWNYYGISLNGVVGTTVSYNTIGLSDGLNALDNIAKFWDDGVDTGNWWDDWNGIGSYPISGGSSDRYPMLFEPTEPIINRPMDVYYAEGSEDNEIVWYPYDDSLKNWTCSIDGKVVEEDAWNFDNITVNIDGLSYGVHVVMLTVFDVDQNNITDTVLVHVYDGTPPTLDTPPNRLAFVDATDQVIVWEAFDLHPEDYSVYDGEEEFATGAWTSGEVEVNIDGLDVGKHVVVLEVRDIDGNSERDTVIVTVIEDDTAPSVDSPDDITYVVDTEENRIIWTPSDEYPDSYVVTENSSTFISGDWGGSRIVVNVDGLAAGTHTFEIEVFDGSGNSVTDEVVVTVLSVQTTTPPPEPLDLQLLLLIGGVVLAVVIVVGAVVYIRKRRA